MGVPQRRERVFFIALRKDLAAPFLEQVDMFTQLPKLRLEFNEPEIKFGEYRDDIGVDASHTERFNLMEFRIKTDKSILDINERLYNKTSGFNAIIVHDDEVCCTITSKGCNWRYYDGMYLTKNDNILTGSFPLDYDFCTNKAEYIIGMSVPPICMAHISSKIYEQWLQYLK